MNVTISKTDRAVLAWHLARLKVADPSTPLKSADDLLGREIERCVLGPLRLVYAAAMVTEARTALEQADAMVVAEQLPAIKTILGVP